MGGVYIGEELLYQRDEENPHDPYAVAVLKSSTVVGHLPRKNIYTLLAVYLKGRCDSLLRLLPCVQYRISFKNLNIREKNFRDSF